MDMKKKYVFVAVLLVALTFVSAAVCMLAPGKESDVAKGDEMLVVTSFYPVYIATLNVADGIEGVRVETLSQPTSGCVHDHQLTTKDMLLLEQADAFVINGAGMESYLEDVMKRYPDIPVIDTSKGCALLVSQEEHLHDAGGEDIHEAGSGTHVHEDSEEHNHVDNSHIWLDMENYCIQIGNIENGLKKLDETHKEQYEEHSSAYQKQVKELLAKGREKLTGTGALHAVSTHEAFEYLASNFDGVIEETINMDENTSLSASQVSEVIEAVQEHDILWVWTEEIYGMSLSGVLEKETECQTLVLDTLVSGEAKKDAYLKGMEKNIEALKEAVGDEGE